MRFIPVLHPFFPISGILVLHTVIVFSLSKGRKSCSRAYVNGLILMELTLLGVTMASVAPNKGMIQFWDMLVLASRCVLCPCWLWMALDMSGIKPAGIRPSKVYLLALAPIAVACAILFTNPLHGWYWPGTWFEGRVLAVERGPVAAINTAYCQALLVIGSAIYLVGILRHRGNERLRLIVLGLAYSILFLGDAMWLLGIPIPGLRGVNPLSFFMTISFYAVGISVLLYGFPKVSAPITEDDIRARPRLELPAPVAGGQAQARVGEAGTFSATKELSERQLAILRMVMDGQPYKAIAAVLGIAERTVKYHMGQILDKCDLETREQLIAWAALRGIAPSQGPRP